MKQVQGSPRSIWLPLDLLEQVRIAAEQDDRSISGFVRHVLRREVEERKREGNRSEN